MWCMQKSLSEARIRSQQLDEKNGKLERAIIRQRFESGQSATRSRDEMIAFDEDLRGLVREQVSHIGDLQKEVNTLRSAVKDFWRYGGSQLDPRGGRGSLGRRPVVAAVTSVKPAGAGGTTSRQPAVASSPRRRGSLDRETARLTKAAEAVQDVLHASSVSAADGRVQLPVTARKGDELRQAKDEINAGARRIAQLEHWLDEIYNDRDLGLGPRGGAGQGGAGGGRSQGQGGRRNGELLLLHDEKPGWDFRTKLAPVVVSKSAAV